MHACVLSSAEGGAELACELTSLCARPPPPVGLGVATGSGWGPYSFLLLFVSPYSTFTAPHMAVPRHRGGHED